MFNKLIKSYVFWIVVAVVAFVGFVVFMQISKSEQYIIGDVVEISSGSAKMNNFDEEDGSYTADADKLFIRFEPDSCEFFDEDGEPCTALDIEIGSRVKMTSRSGLKTDRYGYTTVYIDKVEVIMDAMDNARYKRQQAREDKE